MKVALISLGSLSSKWTIQAMKKYFSKVEDIDIKDLEVNLSSNGAQVLYQGRSLENFDCIYLKGSYKYVRLLTSITSALEGKTYMPIRADTFTIGHDKLLTHLKLQEKRIPMPSTYISATPTAAKQLLEKLNYPIVMKFPKGTQGKGVMFADSFSSASSMLDALAALNQPVIIQEYIETGGTDIRAIVVGDKVVAAMKRKASEGEKRANIHAGGEGEPCELDKHAQQLAVQTAKAIGADICAVDILEGQKGPLVIEVNLSPGLQGITSATKINVADHVAKFLYEQAKKFAGADIPDQASKIFEESGTDKKTNSVITNLDFRLRRIILPQFVTDMAGFKETDEVVITAQKNSVLLTKSNGQEEMKEKKKKSD
ncbi:MAG: RimK family alpha-L-glutamate ligase [Nanoarchaeota archaeon]|nr:RimK family alpha-L-glutamate ligase [Nanoarchaeota archaeon]